MKFLFPTFLFALLAVAIPILIHLFSFKRYKTVYFSNVAFLKDIKKESKKKTRLKQLLILAARILSIVFLVFAFAQPYLPTNTDVQKQPTQLVAVYVDNSFSMNALSEQGQLLEIARNKALEICLAYPSGTKFKLFTNDLKPKHQHIYNREQFIQQVSEIQTSPKVAPLSLIYNRFADLRGEHTESSDKNLYVISDFQRSISDIENFKESNIFSYYFPLKPNQVANLFIDSCWVEVPAHRLGQEENIFVRIKNSSDQEYQNLPIKLYLNDSIKSITNFSVEAQSEIVAELNYTNNSSGTQLGKIEISDYPFTHDNNWYISYFVEKNLKALAIFDDTKQSKEGLSYLKALFANDAYVQMDEMNVKSLKVNQLNKFNAIFLLNLEDFTSGFLNELESVVNKGSSVVLFPSYSSSPAVNNQFLSVFNANRILGMDSTKQEISGIDFENKFFENVFRKKEENPILPSIEGHFRFEQTTRTQEISLLRFQNEDKALSQLNYEDGKVWSFAFPLEKKTASFAKDVLFVPTIYNIVLNSLPKQTISFTVGDDYFYDIPRRLNVNLNAQLSIKNTQTGNAFIPSKSAAKGGIRIEFGDQLASDGHYLVQNDAEILTSMAFNYNRKESDLRYFNNQEIQENLEKAQLDNATLVEKVDQNFSELFSELKKGKQYWKLCILLALIFILSEVLIIRFWK